MKQVSISLKALAGRFHVCSFRNSNSRLSKNVLFFCLSATLIINSSFTHSRIQSVPTKENQVKPSDPFKGKMTLDLSNGVVGTGEASHIGRFEYVAQDDRSKFPFITGTVTITAANGDQLFLTHSGYAEDLGNGTLKVTLEHIITGGTGRFADASGSYLGISTVNLKTQTATAAFKGTISY